MVSITVHLNFEYALFFIFCPLWHALIENGARSQLGEIGSEKAVDALLQALKDKDSYVGFIAAHALGNIGSEKAVDALLQALKDEDSYLKRIAAEALGKIGSEKAVDVLLQALKDEDLYVKRIVGEVLGKIGSEKAVDVLLQALKDEDLIVRSFAAEALGDTVSLGSLGSLEKLLQLPNLNMDATIFLVARSWAIRFSKSGSPYIPVYPELLPHTCNDGGCGGVRHGMADWADRLSAIWNNFK